jgi:hypothetical protein
MAGNASKFLHGATLEIVINDPGAGGVFTMAYAQAISFSHNMRNLPVAGIGSHGHHALEPVQYSGQGSLVITRYSAAAKQKGGTKIPGNIGTNNKWGSGNGLLHRIQFNPIKMLVSQTFDITVRSKLTTNSTAVADASNIAQLANKANAPGATQADKDAYALAVGQAEIDVLKQISTSSTPAYTIYDCRLTNFSFNLTTAGLLNETVSFVCRGVMDHTINNANEVQKQNNNPPA